MRGLLAPLLKLVTFLVVTVVATGVLAATIANTGASGGKSVTARFSDVTGLNVGDEVRISGVRIGRVDKIAVADRRLADVTFSLEEGRSIPASAGAELRYRNLVGQRYMAITRGTTDATDSLPDNGTIPLERTKPALDLTVLFNGFKPLFQALDPETVNTFSYQIIQVLQGESGTVSQLVSTTSSLTNSLADSDQVIGDLITNLNSVLDIVNQRQDKVNSLVISLQQLVSGLNSDRDAIGSSITSLSRLTDVTAGLLTEARAPLQADIAAVGDLSDNLNRNNETLNTFFTNLPIKADSIGRAASYGSWFQFYLCGLNIKAGLGGYTPDVALPNGLPTIQLPLYTNTAQRCSR